MQLRSLLEFAVQGKHFLMNMFIDQLKDEGIQDDQIIHINFEDLAFNNLKNQMDLYKFVHEHENKEKKNYLFFDEIQNVQNLEKAINSFRVDMDADIYITGSNSYLLSGEMATLLSGRYVELLFRYPLFFNQAFKFVQTLFKSLEGIFQVVRLSHINTSMLHDFSWIIT